jgi:hypothetical protein
MGEEGVGEFGTLKTLRDVRVINIVRAQGLGGQKDVWFGRVLLLLQIHFQVATADVTVVHGAIKIERGDGGARSSNPGARPITPGALAPPGVGPLAAPLQELKSEPRGGCSWQP